MIKKTVLFINGETEMLEDLSLTLKKYFRILKASNCEEARALLREWKVDCLVTDIDMSKINGTKLIEMMQTAHCPSQAIVVTVNYSEEIKMSCKTLGVDDFFPKPVSARDLIKKIEELIGE